MIREEIKKLTEKAVKDLYGKEVEVRIEQPQDPVFGDYATNVAMTLKKNPQEIASQIKSDILEKAEVKNSFINFFISKAYLQKQVKEILKEKDKFGGLKIGKGEKVNVEFISANPTGPLTLGNGRGGFCGDVLANVLQKAKYKVTREYYINDIGGQITRLGYSYVSGPSEFKPYQNADIDELKKDSRVIRAIEEYKNYPDPDKGNEIGKVVANIFLKEKIKPIISEMKINFDVWFSEKSLYRGKEKEKIINEFQKKNLVYYNKEDKTLWFKSTKFDDDKDRVLIKGYRTGREETYFLSDIIYLKNKFKKRKFNYLIYFWGADHFGYINRIKAAAEALGFDKDKVRMIIMQLVRLIQQGKEVRMSKRTGTYVTLDELIDEVGLDVARFFFLTRSPDTHLNFDLDLAKEQSEKNPVYYIQYAHARICSILKKATVGDSTKHLKLEDPAELRLVKQLIRLPEIIEDISKDYQVQRLSQYAVDLATTFHKFYQECRVISEDKNLTQARLSLVLATKIVLKNTLDLMGISAPEEM
ncbi:MAG: arginine--tRNA ligase [Candidatus Pacebacteria bacterium]|nr:arginine--tRNA ligase [Candidatus Paceibacterota bacterium]